jgi:hypothetical protein
MIESPTRIPVEKLRQVFDLLISHVTRVSGSEIELSKDAFWSIPAGAVYNVYADPQELTIGMISESWSHLEAMADGEKSVVGYGLVWLAEVLRAIGDETAA